MPVAQTWLTGQGNCLQDSAFIVLYLTKEETVNSVKLTDNVFWVGALDPDLRKFDITVETAYGTTYNSYLIRAEKNALIDAVKAGFEDQLLKRVEEHIPVERLDYLIINHTEPDHSGSLLTLMQRNPKLKLRCSMPALPFVRNILNDDSYDLEGVKEGDTLDLGGATLEFISAPYLHWPDVMFTYCIEKKILFPCDAFAAHICPTDTIFYQPGDEIVDHETWYYYDSIMRPYSDRCRRATEKVVDREIDICAPSHGLVNRDDPKRFINKYLEWTEIKKPSDRPFVVIAYTSSYGHTRQLAE
jgi:flavorubredoxin